MVVRVEILKLKLSVTVVTVALCDKLLFENSTTSPTLNWDLKLDKVEVTVAVCPAPDPDWLLKIGPEPGNATLTSNSASAVPLELNVYCLMSPNP